MHSIKKYVISSSCKTKEEETSNATEYNLTMKRHNVYKI